MAKKQTSARVSSVAAKLTKLTGGQIYSLAPSGCRRLATAIRVVCASALSQDETPRAARKR